MLGYRSDRLVRPTKRPMPFVRAVLSVPPSPSGCQPSNPPRIACPETPGDFLGSSQGHKPRFTASPALAFAPRNHARSDTLRLAAGRQHLRPRKGSLLGCLPFVQGERRRVSSRSRLAAGRCHFARWVKFSMRSYQLPYRQPEPYSSPVTPTPTPHSGQAQQTPCQRTVAQLLFACEILCEFSQARTTSRSTSNATPRHKP